MSSDINLPLALKHDQATADMAYPSVSGNVYSNFHVHDGARAHVGNSYSYGPTEDQQILQSILQSLHYPEMGQRGRDVSDSKAGTFEWLFEDLDDQTSHISNKSDRDDAGAVDVEGGGDEGSEPSEDDALAHDINENRDGQEDMFEEEESDSDSIYSDYSYAQRERNDLAMGLRCWLKDDRDSVFWVTGKPGSGKSTLLKFLRDHDSTYELLREWAQEHHLIVADHFFWLPGTQLQNSFEGLARSLMHSILSFFATDTDSAKAICGKRRWSLNTSNRPWSQSELKRMFSNLGGLRGIRLFILIDGLDECCPQDSHDELMDMLMDIVQRPNFKICLSSRPWKEFAAKLCHSPSLRLDQISHLDMIAYTKERIYKTTRDQRLTAREINDLVRLVTDRADGVFLWVELVVRALDVELKKDRGLSRVHSIVNDFPSELDEYFTALIFERIEKTSGNTTDTASVLSLAIQLRAQSVNGFTFPFIDFWLLSRGALDHDLEFPGSNAPKNSRTPIAVMRQQTQTFLELTSKDLLVLSGDRVDFLHRTIYDFLKRNSINETILQGSPAHFQRPDFLSKVFGLRCMYAMMAPDVQCGQVDLLLADAVSSSGENATTRTLATICESLAIDHLQNARSCFGSVSEIRGMWSSTEHQIKNFMAGPVNLATDWLPCRYIRAFFRHWPHTANTMLTGQDQDYMTISHLRLRDLCRACTDIMHDCIYHGAVPNDWLTRLVPREDFERIRGKHVQTDDGPQHSTCEFCKVYLPYSRDCGLKDTFFLSEKIAFENVLPKVDLPAHTLVGSPTSERRIAKLLPFELPWSILHRVDGLQALSATSQFQQFVWCRQKLRAARSLITTVRRHISRLASSESTMDASGVHLYDIQAIWLSFLRKFIEPPAARDIDDGHSGLQCSFCGCRCCRDCLGYCPCARCAGNCRLESVVVLLQPDGFPLFCKDCYRKAASQRGSSPSFVLTFQFRLIQSPGRRLPPNGNTAKAVSDLIAWYSATAPAFGLGYLIPSDVAEIQQALLTVPEAPLISFRFW
ncbi:hypothetical protein Q7P36_006114 [Cladosporium allicinum]